VKAKVLELVKAWDSVKVLASLKERAKATGWGLVTVLDSAKALALAKALGSESA